MEGRQRSGGLWASLMVGLVVALFAAASTVDVAWAAGTTYYVDGAGDDSNAGTSPSGAWRSIGKVNALDLEPGDRVLFAGGQSFSGNLLLTGEDAGTAASPVVVGSYGEKRATIEAGAGKGVGVYNAGGVEVRDLTFVGAGRENGNRESGVEFYTDLGGARKLSHVRVENVEASGFGQSGVLLGAWPHDGSKSGYRDVRIVGVSAHDNADAGIQTYGYYDPSAAGWAHEDVYVGHSRAYGNRGIPNKGNNSGSGIVVSDVDGATVERNIAHDNGELSNHGGGGPVGIWAWESNRVVIQHNESHHNRTATIDGGGFDLDGGVTNSVMQHNYSHDNAGAGYLLYQFSGAGPYHDNAVRYNVSENDGRTNLGGIAAGGGATQTEVHNNTVYASPRTNGDLPAAVRLIGDGTSGFRFRNNIFSTIGGTPLVDAAGNHPGLLFRGNDYWSGNDPFAIRHGGATYPSLDAWRGATGQERDGAGNTGLAVDPGLTAPGGGGTVGDADRLSTLEAYKLRPGSPLIDAGLDLRDSGLAPGPTDFYGTPLPRGAGYDVGAHEASSEDAPPPNAAPGIMGLRPTPESSTRDRTPTVDATVRDAETDLAKTNIKLFLDGRRVYAFRYYGGVDRLAYTTGRLAPGRHTARIVATDDAGSGASRTWAFGVVR